MAVFVDPVGAFVLGLAARHHPGAQLVNEPGTWSWSELLTTDLEASKAFYGAVFGWDTNVQDAGPMGEYVEWQVHGRSVAGMMQKPPMLPAEVPPHWAVYFAVSDTDAAVEPRRRARRHGDDAADGHRAGPVRARDRSHRCGLQRHRAQARARRLTAEPGREVAPCRGRRRVGATQPRG